MLRVTKGFRGIRGAKDDSIARCADYDIAAETALDLACIRSLLHVLNSEWIQRGSASVSSQGAHPGEAVIRESPRLIINGQQPAEADGELFRVAFYFDPSIAVATYDAGAKLDWHIHPGGQVLLITEGTGFYQERGKPVQIVHKGDVIKCAPGVAHWHGALRNRGFAYIAVTPTQKGKTVWLEPVSEQAYKGLKSYRPPEASKGNE